MPSGRRAAEHEASIGVTSAPSPQTNVRIEHLTNTRWHEPPHPMQGQRDQPSESTQLMHRRINRPVGSHLDESSRQVITRHDSRQVSGQPGYEPRRPRRHASIRPGGAFQDGDG